MIYILLVKKITNTEDNIQVLVVGIGIVIILFLEKVVLNHPLFFLYKV